MIWGYPHFRKPPFVYELISDICQCFLGRIPGIKFLQNHCAGVGMDGVIWIMGEASGAFTLLGLLSRKTVLMEAAQDGTNHDEAKC